MNEINSIEAFCCSESKVKHSVLSSLLIPWKAEDLLKEKATVKNMLGEVEDNNRKLIFVYLNILLQKTYFKIVSKSDGGMFLSLVLLDI